MIIRNIAKKESLNSGILSICQQLSIVRTMSESTKLEVDTKTEGDYGNRKFYDISSAYSEQQQRTAFKTKSKPDTEKLIHYIQKSIIGREAKFVSPFGYRNVVYCDYTASGRSLSFIENYIQTEVLPTYGNTHTTTTVTSLQTTLFRHEARDIIRNAVNASEYDSVIFTGNGCTAAVHKLIHVLNLKEPPIIFVGPYEHHSNLLPWRELGGKIIRINETTEGSVDLTHLEKCLQDHQDSGRQLIGCFSAASNITGILADDKAITILLHKYNALSFWDYATAAPYVEIDMNPLILGENQGLVYKDAIFISPHKFIGGVGTPGILVAKKKLFVNPVPSCGGGGSVFFVRRENHRYLQEIEMREEGGTPAIVESVRAGLVFQLKQNVSSAVIMQKEEELCRKAFSVWQNVPNLRLLGSTALPRLPIFSFMIKHPISGYFLHHNFVCAILNDLFGIQARGGCNCAGPYAQELLGINEELAKAYEKILLEDSRLDRTQLRRYREYSEKEILRPGFIRLNLSYFMPNDEVEFILNAVKLVAQDGWKLLPQYIMNPETGEWRHYTNQIFKDRKWLGSINYLSGEMKYPQPLLSNIKPLPGSFQDCLMEAQEVFKIAPKVALRRNLGDQTTMFEEAADELRWFLLPSEAKLFLNNNIDYISKAKPFLPIFPKSYPNSISSNNRTYNSVNSASDEIDKAKTLINDSEMTSGNVVNDLLENRLSEPLSKNNCDVMHETGIISQINTSNPRIEQLQNIDKNSDNIFKNSSITEEKTKSSVNQNKSIVGVKENKTKKKACDCSSMACKVNFSVNKNVVKAERAITVTGKWQPPPKELMKPTIQAITDFNMIQSGDKILVCLSGGKDSLSLLHVIRQYQFFSRSKGIEFTFGAVTVDPQSDAYDPSSLKPYIASLGIPYFYEEQGILEHASSIPELSSICSFCSRMKRGRLYACARREGYNVLAFGQHLDDLCETFLMSAFHNGKLRTMKAHYHVKEEDLRVIRPFVYVREKITRNFAETRKLPVIAENCPACFEVPKERHRTKQLLAQQEVLFHNLFGNLKGALRPLMAINCCGMEGEELIYRSLKELEKYDNS